MIAPVAGSGSWPSWIARVSKSMRVILRTRDLFGSQHPGELGERCIEGVVERPADAWLGMERLDLERALGSIVLEVGTADEPVLLEEREHVVAVDPLVLALVDLDHVAEAEDALEERPVPDEIVERREKQCGRDAAVRLHVGRYEHGRLAVVDVELAELALGDERLGVRPDPRGPAAQAPHLRDP